MCCLICLILQVLRANIAHAVDIMHSYPGVISDDRRHSHVTFMYLCCVTQDDSSSKIYPALDAVKWKPINVSFDKVSFSKESISNTVLTH